MRKEIKYIGFYDLTESKVKRVANLAAINKMDYIADAIQQAGYDVHIISPSWSADDDTTAGFHRKETIQICPGKKVTFCPTFNTNNKITRNIKIIYTLFWLFFWLLKNTKANEKILLYHVQWLSLPIRWVKKMKHFQLILEVEEFYNQIWKNKGILHKWEQKLIDNADKYIVVSDVLANILGSKVQAIVYGNYKVPETKYSKSYFDNDKINVVYAGSIDETKGGAITAVECSLLLSEEYLVHVSGHGSESSVKNLIYAIEDVNRKAKRTVCIYHGCLSDNELISFLKHSQIAINPQYSDNKFRFLFPSKIIKYLACNLRVVSTRVESIEKSKIGHLISFSKDDQPESIVNSILSLNLETHFNSAPEIQKLNKEFVQNLEILLI